MYFGLQALGRGCYALWRRRWAWLCLAVVAVVHSRSEDEVVVARG
jgi:hypothetical protein